MDFISYVDEKMQTIEYGWLDKNNHRQENFSGFSKNYLLQLPEQLASSKLGVCWDQVELERKLFADKNIVVRSFFFVYYGEKKCPTHTVITFERAGKIYWYEHAWAKSSGVHQYDDLKMALKAVQADFIDQELSDGYNPENLVIYEYDAPKKRLNCAEFYKHCEKGKIIKI